MTRFTPEKAAELLKKCPNMPAPIKGYLEQVSKGNLVDFYAKRFNNLLKIRNEEENNLGYLVYDAETDGFRHIKKNETIDNEEYRNLKCLKSLVAPNNEEFRDPRCLKSLVMPNYVSVLKYSIRKAMEDGALVPDDGHGVVKLDDSLDRFLKREFSDDGNYSQDQLMHMFAIMKFVKNYFEQKTKAHYASAENQDNMKPSPSYGK